MERHKLCPSKSEILDSQNGHYVCTACGLVLDSFYLDTNQYNIFENQQIPDKWIEETKDILDRINIPVSFTDHILKHFELNYRIKNSKYLLDSIYTVLNNLGIPISLNELANVNGCLKNKINCKNVTEINNVQIDKFVLIEKYCAILQLDFKTTTLIKEKLSKVKKAGHSPTTVVGALIYSTCKELKLKKTIKDIALATSVSPISIQRYLKYEHSQR